MHPEFKLCMAVEEEDSMGKGLVLQREQGGGEEVNSGEEKEKET